MADQTTEEQQSNNHLQYTELSQSLEKTLSAEKINIEKRRQQLENLSSQKKALEAEFHIFKIQISTYNNLLALPSTSSDDLKKISASFRSSLDLIEKRLAELIEKRDQTEQFRLQAEQQNALNEKQLSEIQSKKQEDPLSKTLMEELQRLTALLAEKREILEKIHVGYMQQILQLEELRKDFISLAEKLSVKLKEKESQELFVRQTRPLELLSWSRIVLEIQTIAEKAKILFKPEVWTQTLQAFWQSNRFFSIAFILLFGITHFLVRRFRYFFLRLEQIPFCSNNPWRCLTLQVFHNSLTLLGITLFIYIYAQIRMLYSSFPIVQLAVHILLIWLISGWWLDFMELWSQGKGRSLSSPWMSHFRAIITLCRFFGISYIIMEWLLGSSSVILFLFRFLFEILLVVWCIPFWKLFRETLGRINNLTTKTLAALKPAIAGSIYAIAGGGLLLELSGFGQLAYYWYTSWGKTGIVFLWGTLFLLLIRELDKEYRERQASEEEAIKKHSQPIRWLLIKVSYLAVISAVFVCLLLAWDASHSLIIKILLLLNEPFPFGGFQIRILGILYAALIFLVTHAATRLWRHIFKEKFLADSGLEVGFQESITTIITYFIWAFGIIWGLNVLGMSTTSLAVAFGALGIGLGFGLQTIFNNFISGIILLFERPIQVGDVIEINEKWGTVIKINVRSTIVQTYDNASLIIPNSEFISSQLTNWSFKDLRVRRNINVGVAYGSDIDLVRSTLLEIANRHPRVFVAPKSDVLFTDFADSALTFRLRVWCHIDYALSVETEIRFEIDRLFRERKIQIPFPQRDVHLFSAQQETDTTPIEPNPDTAKE